MMYMQGSLRKRGSAWYYSFELTSTGGKRRRIERAGGRTKKEAEAAMRRAMSEFETTGRIFSPSEMSFIDYMEYWLKEYVELNLKPNTLETYSILYRSKIKPAFKDYRLRAISTPLLQSYFNDLFRSGVSKNTFDVLYAIISGALKYAHSPCGYIQSNPIRSVVKPKYAPIREKNKVITPAEMKELLANLEDTPVQLPYVIAYYTGFRIAECLGLTWDDVDFKAGTITINKILTSRHSIALAPPKTQSSYRTIPVSIKLLSRLRQHKAEQAKQRLRYGEYYANYFLAEDGHVIRLRMNAESPVHFVCTHENGEVIQYSHVQNRLESLRKKLHFSYTFHDLRHTHATMLIEGGANPKDVQERLGHSSFSTTMNTYAHATESMKKESVAIFDKVSADIL